MAPGGRRGPSRRSGVYRFRRRPRIPSLQGGARAGTFEHSLFHSLFSTFVSLAWVHIRHSGTTQNALAKPSSVEINTHMRYLRRLEAGRAVDGYDEAGKGYSRSRY
ncbi:hypothetical protein T439DRAFT_3652 [Meredithblackwellia eburnea MCA 4105]